MFDWLNGLVADARVLIVAAAIVMWLGATLAVAARTRSVASTAFTFLAGAFLAWGVANADLIRDRAGQDVQGLASTVTVIVPVDAVAPVVGGA
jgi:hypothetical protein